jgi:hypothetical protein
MNDKNIKVCASADLMEKGHKMARLIWWPET